MKALFASMDAGLIGLLFFFIVFCAIAVWVMRPASKERLEAHRYIPLEETSDDPAA